MRTLVITLSLLALAACDQASQSSRSAETPESPAVAESQSELRGEEITYHAGDVELKGYLVYDAKAEEPRPGVLVVHEWWGQNDYARNRAYMLAQQGYTALALDMYGEGKVAEHPADAEKFMSEVATNMDLMQARFEAAKAVLQGHESVDSEQIAAIGYCFGGAVVLNMARQGADLKGVASFHGSLATAAPAEEGAVQARVLVLHGDEDPMVPPEHVEAFKEEMEAARADYEFVGYPGVTHSFTNPAATEVGERFGLPLAYDENADEDSWARLQAFLKNIFEN